MKEPIGSKTRERTIECPHCGKAIRLAIRTEIVEVAASGEQVDWRTGISELEQQAVQFAKDSGIFAAFSEVVRRVKSATLPQRMEKYWLNFLKSVRHKAASKFALDCLSKEFGGARIQVLALDQIGMVLADGIIRAFIPSEIVEGRKIAARGKAKARLPFDEGAFSDWIRTRFGYVAGKGAMFEALQQKSIGAFDLPPRNM